MEIAKIQVDATTGRCLSRKRIPAGLVGGTVSVEFAAPIWCSLSKTVVFRCEEIKVAEFDGMDAVIPWELVEKPGKRLYFGIWGNDPDSDLQLPLIEVPIGVVEESTDPNADPGTDPTMPIWADLKSRVENLEKNGTGGPGNNESIINLAERYDIVLEDTLELFYSGIINVGNIQNFIVECSSDVGEAYEKKYMFTPSADDAGKNYTLTLTVKDNYGNIVESAQTTIVVCEISEQTAQIEPSGSAGYYASKDGTVANQSAGFYLHIPIELNSSMKTLRLVNVLVNPYVPKIAYSNSPTLALGEKLQTVALEGDDGDAVSVDIGIDTSYRYLYISANCSSSGSVRDTGEEYYIISGGENTKIGNVMCVGDSLTANGIWVKEFQNRLTADGFDGVTLIGSQVADTVKHEGHSGFGYGSYLLKNVMNPFWNPDTSQIDFANYMTTLGLSGQVIDYCIILLGWNETTLSETDFKSNVENFCTNLRSVYPNCKILFVGLQIPSLDGLGANYGTSWKWKDKCDFVHNLDKWYQDIVESMDNAKTIQLCSQFDTEHNMPTEPRQVNRRNPAQKNYGTNGVHPNEYGYLQIADAVYRGFVTF